MTMAYTIPISVVTQQKIINLTEGYIVQAGDIFNREFNQIDIRFDLTGRAAGMYKVDGRCKQIRFNPDHFATHRQENIRETIPHEVAHYIISEVYGIRNVKPHGLEWQALMRKFGVEPRRTYSYSLDGIPTRQHRRYLYACACREFEITTRRHNSIQSGRAYYTCKDCGDTIKKAGH